MSSQTILFCLAAILLVACVNSQTQYIIYTGYTGANCANLALTSYIASGQCGSERRATSSGSGTVTYNSTTVSSCEFSDLNCQTMSSCTTYTIGACLAYGNGNSAKYTIGTMPVPVQAAAGSIIYTGYASPNCQNLMLTSYITSGNCGYELVTNNSSGLVTSVNSTTVQSCDYSDLNCGTQTSCELLTVGQCYTYTSGYSNMYSYATVSATAAPTSAATTAPTSASATTAPTSGATTAPVNPTTAPVNPTTAPVAPTTPSIPTTGPYIVYTGYNSPNCNHLFLTSYITPGVCGTERRANAAASGLITITNSTSILSCDYDNLNCGSQNTTECVNYGVGQCTSYSNGYSDRYDLVQTIPAAPVANASNPFQLIVYTGYASPNCQNLFLTSYIYSGVCGAEMSGSGDSGVVIGLNSTTISSCDYSDQNCANPIVCTSYAIGACRTYSNGYSDMYSYALPAVNPTSNPNAPTVAPTKAATNNTSPATGDAATVMKGSLSVLIAMTIAVMLMF